MSWQAGALHWTRWTPASARTGTASCGATCSGRARRRGGRRRGRRAAPIRAATEGRPLVPLAPLFALQYRDRSAGSGSTPDLPETPSLSGPSGQRRVHSRGAGGRRVGRGDSRRPVRLRVRRGGRGHRVHSASPPPAGERASRPLRSLDRMRGAVEGRPGTSTPRVDLLAHLLQGAGQRAGGDRPPVHRPGGCDRGRPAPSQPDLSSAGPSRARCAECWSGCSACWPPSRPRCSASLARPPEVARQSRKLQESPAVGRVVTPWSRTARR